MKIMQLDYKRGAVINNDGSIAFDFSIEYWDAVAYMIGHYHSNVEIENRYILANMPDGTRKMAWVDEYDCIVEKPI
jgi:hypothetical protein